MAALAMHREQLREHGGADGVLDMGALEASLCRPRNLLHYENATLPRLAAALAFGVVTRHPFQDGNKRAALTISETFVVLNGYELGASDEETYKTFLSLADGSMSEAELVCWFETHLDQRGQ